LLSWQESGGFAAADPASDDAGDRRRVVLGERLGAFDLAQVRGRGELRRIGGLVVDHRVDAAARATGLALIGTLVFFGLIRPALKTALAPPPPPTPGAQLSAVVDDPQDLPALPAPKSLEHLNGARSLAKDNPAAVAGIVRGWVNGAETMSVKS